MRALALPRPRRVSGVVRSPRVSRVLRVSRFSCVPRPSRVFLAAFAVFFTLSACWSLATPMFASPDETSHLVKAAATVRGEFGGKHGFVEQMMFQGPSEQPTRSYRVPAAYAAPVFPCFAFSAQTTPKCEKHHAEHPPSRTGSLTMYTTAGHYNPTYYLLVGWPSLVAKGVHGMYLLRLASALLNSLLLAGAVALAAAWRRPGFLLAGLLTAATPMVLFLNGMVNPNSLEVSSAVLAWVAALSLTLQPDPALRRRRVVTLVGAGALLVNVRPLGYEWLAAILGTALFVAAGRGAVTAVLRSRTTWYAAGAASPALLFGLWWTLRNGDDAKVPYVKGNALVPAAHSTLNGMQWDLQSMIGVFGWLDTPSPMVVYDLWIGVALLLTLVAAACGRWRQVLAVLALGVGIVAIPVVAQGFEARHVGLIWQGRYLLAFAAGLPILAGAVLAARAAEAGSSAEAGEAAGAGLPSWLDRRVVLTVGTVLAFADLAAFFRSLRRYLTGLDGRLLWSKTMWEPPGHWELWAAVYVLALAASIALCAALAGPPGRGLPRLRRRGADAGSSGSAITRPRPAASGVMSWRRAGADGN